MRVVILLIAIFGTLLKGNKFDELIDLLEAELAADDADEFALAEDSTAVKCMDCWEQYARCPGREAEPKGQCATKLDKCRYENKVSKSSINYDPADFASCRDTDCYGTYRYTCLSVPNTYRRRRKSSTMTDYSVAGLKKCRDELMECENPYVVAPECAFTPTEMERMRYSKMRYSALYNKGNVQRCNGQKFTKITCPQMCGMALAQVKVDLKYELELVDDASAPHGCYYVNKAGYFNIGGDNFVEGPGPYDEGYKTSVCINLVR